MVVVLLREVKIIDDGQGVEMLGFAESLELDAVPEVGEHVKGEKNSDLYEVVRRIHVGIDPESKSKPYTKLLVVNTGIKHEHTD